MNDSLEPSVSPSRRKSLSKVPGLVDANNIRVAVRIRPFSAKELSEGNEDTVLDFFGTTISAKSLDRYGMESEYIKERNYAFDVVFGKPEVTQLQVFEELGTPILENAMEAYNGCIMAYGQTGSGKSYSMLGDPTSEVEKGILPRACEMLFDLIERQREAALAAGTPVQITVLASYLEIYQENLFDLLVNTRTNLQVRLHPTLGPHVPGLTESPVVDIDQVRELLDFGAKNRAVGATSMNAHSSRSHAVFSVDLRLSFSGPDLAKDLQSRIHFVDLAGSERQKKTNSSGDRLQEGIAINQSLSSLSRVIQALAGKLLPVFRESKLTLLLKDALSGNSRTVLMACVSPSRTNLEESVSTLDFAARCKLIKTNAKKNEQDKRELIETLSQEKQQVQAQLEEELQQRALLQRELEREMEESRKNQELVQKMEDEKLAIEGQLKQLETQANDARLREKRASVFGSEMNIQLQKAEQELQLARRAQEAKEKEWADLQQANEIKEAELQRSLEQAQNSAELQRQLDDFHALREREAAALEEERAKLQERERANQELQRQQLEQLERKKAEELSHAQEERKRSVAELQEKLVQVRLQEEDERRRVEENAKNEVELRQRIEQEMQRVQGREEDLRRELQGLQSLSESWELKNQDLEMKAQEQKRFRESLLKELGIMGMDADSEDTLLCPRLVNMNPDPSLEGCLIYYLPLGDTRIGADQQRCRVRLAGLDVIDEVCSIANDGNERLEVQPLPGGLVRVNGVHVGANGSQLASGDRLAIGRAHIFRVVIPRSHSAQTDRDEEDFSQAMQELQACAEVDPRWRRGVDAAVMVVKRDYGTREANLLVSEAKAASEVVAEANAILKLVPQAWSNGVSHYELAVLFEADGPPVVCVVARQEPSAGSEALKEDEPRTRILSEGEEGPRAFSAGIWEAGRFVETRLSLMQEAAEQLRLRPSRSFLGSAAGSEEYAHDWASHAMSEVELETFHDLWQSHKELQTKLKKKLEEDQAQEAAGVSIWDWLSGTRNKKKEKETDKASPSRLWDWLLPGNSNPALPAPKVDFEAVLKAKAAKVRQKREASEPLKARRSSRAPPPPASFMLQNGSQGGDAVRRAASLATLRKPEPGANDEASGPVNFPDRVPRPTTAASKSDADQRDTFDIVVKELFEGRLGVRLRMEHLVISNFDVPEAAELGWKLGDEITKVNGTPVTSREDFRAKLADARNVLPIVFTIERCRKGPRASVLAESALQLAEGPRSSISTDMAKLTVSLGNFEAPRGGPTARERASSRKSRSSQKKAESPAPSEVEKDAALE